ncbi:hypothetical protein ACQKLP_12850 [Chitinophaga sp. NPDC101104]|uniref:hypothetical protein n=1 Tax=Chitinophaga sp. NPDC101104 TaxID=3390561 RepID=UPI003CFDFC65
MPLLAGVLLPAFILVVMWSQFIARGLLTNNGKISWPLALFVVAILSQVGVTVFLLLTRLVRMEISDYGIKAKNFYGYGQEKEWLFAHLEGYSIKVQDLKNKGVVEFLILWKDGKKVLRINDSYFDNYFEIKEAVSAKLKNLGER